MDFCEHSLEMVVKFQHRRCNVSELRSSFVDCGFFYYQSAAILAAAQLERPVPISLSLLCPNIPDPDPSLQLPQAPLLLSTETNNSDANKKL